MLIVDVPKNPLTSQRLELDEDGIEYVIRTRWVSSYQNFYMDILDTEGNILSSSIKILPGAPLNLSQVREDGPKGVFTVSGTGDLTRTSFSDGSYKLYYTPRNGVTQFPLNRDYLVDPEEGTPVPPTIIPIELFATNTAKTDGISQMLYRDAFTPSAAGYTIQGWFKIQSGLVGKKDIMLQLSDDPISEMLFTVQVEDNTTDVTFSATVIDDSEDLISVVGGTFAYDQTVHVLLAVSETEIRLFTNGTKYNTEIPYVPVDIPGDETLAPMEFEQISFHDRPITDEEATSFFNGGQARCDEVVEAEDPDIMIGMTAWHYCSNWTDTTGQELDNKGTDGILLMNQDSTPFTGTGSVECLGT